MNKKKLAALIAASLVFVFGPVYWYGSRNATINQDCFHSLDKKKLKKAYGVMFRKILAQNHEYDAVDFNNDEELNIILHREYAKL